MSYFFCVETYLKSFCLKIDIELYDFIFYMIFHFLKLPFSMDQQYISI